MPDTQPVRIDVVSDVVCPWCFIGKHRLEKALALRPSVAVEVHWRPYFLNDWIPREGISREEYLTKKFGSPERYEGIAQRVTAAAAAAGPAYASAKVKRQPMDLYFTQGADLTDRDTLVQAAASVGLDADTVREGLASDQDVAQIEQEALSAKEAGIEGVPCFIFGGKFAVSGAQSPEYLAEAIDRMAQAAQSDAAE